MEILDGRKTSQDMTKDYRDRIKMLARSPKIVVIAVNPDEASNIYINQKQKACKDIGIDFEKQIFPATTTQQEIVTFIEDMNKDDGVDGILLQLPIPDYLDAHYLINAIEPCKDVDGLTDDNTGALIHNQDVLSPCTALAVIDLLDAYNIEIKGKNVVLIGRSNLVGKPLIPLFLNRDATVTVVHTKTATIKDFTNLADIIVVAAGQPNTLTADMVKDGTVVIDVGISRIDNKIVGDVDFENVKEKASYITPVPGGVGPMTVQALVRNVYYAYLNRERHSGKCK